MCKNQNNRKEGDWNCLRCGALNFTLMGTCKVCREDRPEQYINYNNTSIQLQ